MKGNISKMFFRNSKIKVAIVVFTLLIMAIIVIFALKGCSNSDGNYSRPNLPDIQFNNDNGYLPNSQNNVVEIPAVTGIVVKSNTLSQQLNISNPSDNKYVFIVEIYLGDGTKLYTSDYIYPSDTVTKVRFNTVLNSGVYKNALMVYTCCTMDDQHTPLTRYEFPIEIRSSIE